MRKLKYLFIMIVMIGVFIKPITSKANEVLEEGVKEIETYGKFNYFRGVSIEEYETGEALRLFYSYFDCSIENGVLEHTVCVENVKNQEFRFQYVYEYEDFNLTNAKVYFDEELIYHAVFDYEFIVEIKSNEKIIVEEVTNIRNDYFTITSYGLLETQEDFELDLESMEEIGLFLIQGHQFIYNEQYKNKDVYFVTSIENLLSFEDIVDKISVSDQTEGDITDNIEIYNNTYNPNDPNIQLGDYKFDIVVYDSAKNMTYQTCYVKVVDVEAPVITAGPAMNVSYTLCYPWSTFLKKFTATDNIKVDSVEITGDTYTDNYNIPGTYYITATAKDTSGNTASATLTVNVIDDAAPKITGPNSITVTTLVPIDRTEIRNQFTFTDVIDENVTQYEIVDLNGYFDKTKVAGKYNFEIKAIDKSGNVGKKSFVLIVKDIDYPSISVDTDYTIIIDSGTTVNRQDIIDLLNELGTLSSNVVDVESELFDETTPTGTYEANIILEDGTIIKNKLVISEVINYNPPVMEQKDNTVFIACLLIITVTVGCIIYFNRVKKKQNRN